MTRLLQKKVCRTILPEERQYCQWKIHFRQAVMERTCKEANPKFAASKSAWL